MARPTQSIPVTQNIFIRLHDALLKKFKEAHRDENIEQLPRYVMYGYKIQKHQEEKPTLIKDILSNSDVKAFLTEKYGEKDNKKIIDGYYLKTRYQDCLLNRKSVIKVADSYAYIFFLYLGYNNIFQWLEILKKEAQDKEDPELLEDIKLQIATLNPEKVHSDYNISYDCYYYSTHRKNIYKLTFQFDLIPIASEPSPSVGVAFPKYKVIAEEQFMKVSRYTRDIYKGFATIKDDVLYIDLESTGKKENLYIVLPIMEKAYFNEKKMNLVLGSYTGRSHTQHIISGEIVMHRPEKDESLKAEQEDKDVPLFIRNYLFARQFQNRAIQIAYDKEILERLASELGRGPSLVRLTKQKYFRVFVINDSKKGTGYDLVEMSLEIEEDFSFIMRSPKRKFTGLIMFKQNNLFTFQGETHSTYFFVSYDLRDYQEKIKKPFLFSGSFTWSEPGRSILYGRTKLFFSNKLGNPSRYIHGKIDKEGNNPDDIAVKAYKELNEVFTTLDQLKKSG